MSPKQIQNKFAFLIQMLYLLCSRSVFYNLPFTLLNYSILFILIPCSFTLALLLPLHLVSYFSSILLFIVYITMLWTILMILYFVWHSRVFFSLFLLFHIASINSVFIHWLCLLICFALCSFLPKVPCQLLPVTGLVSPLLFFLANAGHWGSAVAIAILAIN